ncbi:MAG: thioredoxin family protein [Flavobacteriales bacterium]|jgi:thiol-disulfide isomerase/thioredoxin|nr:thioredoxin family protein [Flavobacteriales bacterium]
MSNTLSNMLPLGTKAPRFELLDTVSQAYKNLEILKGHKGTLVLFICNHCPFVLHINDMLVEMANQYQAKGIRFMAISSNDVLNYPQDGLEFMHQQALKFKYPFPYLYDDTQEVAKAYQAACTPDIFLFDADLRLAYRGQLDDSRPGNGIPVTGKDLKLAMDCVLNGTKVSAIQKPSIGCNIKWK